MELVTLKNRADGNYFKRLRVKTKTASIFLTIVRTVLLLGLSFIIVYPLLYMFSMSFRPQADILDPSVIWIPRTFTLSNIIGVAKVMNYGATLVNTLTIGVVSSLLAVASCCVVGYGFARFKFKGKNILFACVIFSIIVPPQITIIPQYLDFRFFDFFYIGKLLGLVLKKEVTINLINSVWSMYLPAAFANGIRSGLFIYIFRQFFRGLPKDLEDAACVDGCGPIKTFLKIMLPLSTSALITVFLFSFVWYWNDYFYSGMFFSNGNTISLTLASLQSRLYSLSVSGIALDPYSMIVKMQSGCLLAVLPPLLIFIVFQRYFTESIERTGIIG